ncbi:MAG: RpiB/LacA/LacB family sugar-phosphate isomerase [Candidatus Doudnabacteria bacterium]|nr:RpiB/LacA/LacB family sugar-phosphate isomerase [bacterium]MDZ4243903.1 RpiB/LacA/LacB family sugar-phosphate isomerase [Candidatus Doudnabacteria bacterium]
MIYIGADHRGFKLKKELFDYLVRKGYRVVDVGTDSEESVDYPIIAEKVTRKVAEDPNNRGIIVCGSGAGVCIVANKSKGILAAEAWNPEVARAARNDDNINVLCLPADHINHEDAKNISQVFLDTSFGGEDRYKRRLDEIREMENEKK